jgi:hypothetical protein
LISVSFKANQNKSNGEHFFDNRLLRSEFKVQEFICTVFVEVLR